MNKLNSDSYHYTQIATAIQYLQAHYQDQPSLEELAAVVNMSPFHFQRLFTEWAGVSPKQFVRFLSLQQAKQLLQQEGNLLSVADATGLSGTGRLHDLFVQMEGMTPGEYRNGGASLQISYQFLESPFGRLLVAATSKGICRMVFMEEEETALNELQALYPNAYYQNENHTCFARLPILFQPQQPWPQLKLHIKGTPFQLQVWQALLRIPEGRCISYGSMAKYLKQPNASRAVGTAIGANPVAFLIPCHRVIQATGALGGYRWGLPRKTAILGWEAAQTHPIQQHEIVF